MSVITINGPVGSGAIEVGQLVAQELNLNYVDRLVLAEAAKLIHAPVGALLDKEQRVNRFRDRLAYYLQTALERSALYADAGESYFGPPSRCCLARPTPNWLRIPTQPSRR